MTVELKHWAVAHSKIKEIGYAKDVVNCSRLAINALHGEIEELHNKIDTVYFFAEIPLKVFMDKLTEQFTSLERRLAALEHTQDE